MLKAIQAKHIPTGKVVAAIAAAPAVGSKPRMSRYDLAECLGFPLKVVTAKLAKMVRQKILDGCSGETCDCGTPFSLRTN